MRENYNPIVNLSINLSPILKKRENKSVVQGAQHLCRCVMGTWKTLIIFKETLDRNKNSSSHFSQINPLKSQFSRHLFFINLKD